jgi:hypothetical protein
MTIIIHEDGVQREATATEIAEISARAKAEADNLLAAEAAATQRANDKAALLDRLGITADEAALLLG